MRGVFWRKENKNPTTDSWKKLANAPKKITSKYWRSHDMWKIEVPFVFWRVNPQKIVNDCSNFSHTFHNMRLKKKYDFGLKNQLWTHVFWKRGRNSKIPDNFLQTMLQQDYRPNFERTRAIAYEVKFARKAQ